MAEQKFSDHFSSVANAYAAFRPVYPKAMFEILAARAPGHDLAWDCGCGSGQASAGLAQFFDRVEATDPSAEQIANAQPVPKVRFSVASAESAPTLADGSVDLILAAQAAHWFVLPRFYGEVRRVAKPSALLALVTYLPTRFADPACQAVEESFYSETVGPYWPPERAHVDAAYASLDFPFPEEAGFEIAIEADWPLDRFMGYVGTWSAVKEYRKQHGEDPLSALRKKFAAVWGDPEQLRHITWPLAMRLGRVG